MDKKQNINCTVSSCKYNEKGLQKCSLESIIVTPTKGINTGTPDESMCSSYNNKTNN